MAILLAQLRQLSRTGARAQREAVWGLYQQLGHEHSGIHNFAPSTVLRFLELIAGDEDELQALTRVSAAVKAISSRRPLTEQEMHWVQQICNDIDNGRPPRTSGDFSAGKRGRSASDQEVASSATHSHAFMDIPQTAKIDDRPSADSPLPQVAQLRKLLSSPPIAVDPTQVWQLYRTAIDAGLADRCRRLARDDVRDLIVYCGSIGSIAGRKFLAQIETDVVADPLIYSTLFRALVTCYAKLGLLDDARRCYQDAQHCGSLPLTPFVDFGMSLALFYSLRHKEGRALFDKLVQQGEARPSMYAIWAKEYMVTWNIEKAFALFDDMRRRNIEPTLGCFYALACACTQDLDSDRGNKRLSDLIACMKSWGCAPDEQFFVSILKGYHWSGQHSMFDGLVQRLRAHGLGSNAMLARVAMENAAERADYGLAVTMARVAARLPGNIPKVVQVLSRIGLANELSTCVDLTQYPDNNLTANARLCILLSSSEMAATPQALVDKVESMVECGFTPSFKTFFLTIRHIRLYGGVQLAIQTYAKLTAAGVPKSTELLLFVLQMHLELADSEAAIATYEELHERLRDSDFTRFRVFGPTMVKLVLLLIERRGIGEARKALDFLSGLPINRHYLPFAPLIEYYVNHKMFDESRSLVSYIVQHDIPLKPRTVNLYCRHLASHSSTTDLANFLRYVQRTQSLHVVTDDVLGALFALCALEHKVADLEWVVGAMSSVRAHPKAWLVAIDRLVAVDSQILPFVVHTAINMARKRNLVAMDLIFGTVKSPSREIVANLVLTTLKDHNVTPSRPVYRLALSVFTQSWIQNYSSPVKAVNVSMSEESLLSAIGQHITPAVKAHLPAPTLVIAMQALSSQSRTAYKECLSFLSNMSPELLDVDFYCAIAGSCSRYSHVEGVDEVLEAIRLHGFALTSNALLSLLRCYANLNPPRELAFEQAAVALPPPPPDTCDSRLEHQGLSSPLPDTVLPCDATPHVDFAQGTDASGDGTALVGSSDQDRDTAFYLSILPKVMSVWKEFEYLDLPVNASGYAVVAQAHINAGKHKLAEAFFVEMVNRGIPHSEVSACTLITSRLIRNDVSRALEILYAIGNPTRCTALALDNRCVYSLDMVQLTARHFSVIIQHCLAWGDAYMASTIMSAMHEYKLAASPKLYAEVLRRLAQSGSHQAFVNVMRQMVATGATIDDHVMDAVKEYSFNRKALTLTGVNDDS
ncbi:hypothetical protein GGI20_000863 [Coemansia sp. BCRC 34301]|nr:hypothetical protein GGI20_000863 [Coemansia sp. BCRC 34301]